MRACCSANARTVRTDAGTVTVVDCPQCDRSHCGECQRTIADSKARRCPSCGAPVQFARIP